MISSDLEVKSSDNDKAYKVVNKLPESKRGLVVGEQELPAVASNHFTKQEADDCKKESRSNVVSNQHVKVTLKHKIRYKGRNHVKLVTSLYHTHIPTPSDLHRSFDKFFLP